MAGKTAWTMTGLGLLQAGAAHAQEAVGPALPPALSVGAMFLQADLVVKAVMIGLLIASVVTWTVFVAKVRELRRATAAEREIHDAVTGLRSLAQTSASAALAASPLVREAEAELALSADALSDAEGVKERIVSRFERHEAAVARRMTRGINILATIGATAPFVGLFGTVWGIMHAFQAIAIQKNTNLAVVAPAIAEALFATAIGLVAAIPAYIAYNKFSTDAGKYSARLEGFADDLSTAIQRRLSERG